MNEGKTHFADDATLDHIANLERENADLRAQLAAKDAETDRMRPVVEAAIAYWTVDYPEGLVNAIREYESKVAK